MGPSEKDGKIRKKCHQKSRLETLLENALFFTKKSISERFRFELTSPTVWTQIHGVPFLTKIHGFMYIIFVGYPFSGPGQIDHSTGGHQNRPREGTRIGVLAVRPLQKTLSKPLRFLRVRKNTIAFTPRPKNLCIYSSPRSEGSRSN